MADYLSITQKERKAMLKSIGVSSLDALFEDIPSHLKISSLDIPKGKSQQEALEIMEELAAKNTVYRSIMRGAGSYNHYIPSVVKSLAARSEFLTAYTPYQPELSQGILQAIFEYQSMICALTGMDVSNASVYNKSTAAAEAVLMCADRVKNCVLVAQNVHPDALRVISTYAAHRNMNVKTIPCPMGVVDLEALEGLLEKAACVYIEQPNYFGLLENAQAIGQIAHSGGAKLIMGCNPISLALLKSPRECGADIAVGEGQPLGLPMSFGGPYLGFMGCTDKDVRKMAGRIVGKTQDSEGRDAYVLTLQAREQHIRREKAFSNICSNQAHCALTAAIYMAAMGNEGLKEVANACVELAHYAALKFCEAGARLKYEGEFFHEFVTITNAKAQDVLNALNKKGILGGLALGEHEILWCMTEKVSKRDINSVAQVIRRLEQSI